MWSHHLRWKISSIEFALKIKGGAKNNQLGIGEALFEHKSYG